MVQAALYERLRAAAEPHWSRYVDHEFVRQLGAGTLAPHFFRYYLVQDYLFLRHLARAYGLAAYKSSSLEELRQAGEAMRAIADIEISHHIAYCARHGVDKATLEAGTEDLATSAYARYVLDVGQAGDLLDLHAALAPCVVGYAEIGTRLTMSAEARRDGNRYWDWIEMYAGKAYQAVAEGERAMLGRLGKSRGAEARLPQLQRVFDEAVRLETGFWDMALRASTEAGARA
ncbi:MAG: thiaminase II [Alphaproteobacteria bacterium]|nr:thiaminase II [Alphaproteobacteria bacterium]